MRRSFIVVFGWVLAAGCSAASPPSATSATSATSVTTLTNAMAPVTGASCAADAPWVAQVGGPFTRSTSMRFDAMRRRGAFGPQVPIVTYNDFTNVTRASEEKYEFPDPAKGHRDLTLVVLRNASGAIPSGYGAPVRLPSGVLEHPPTSSRAAFGLSPLTLFVFADGTWVRTEGAMTDRFRTLFAMPGKAPPLPVADGDVAWELCGKMDVNEISLPYDRWTIEGTRVAVRLFASRPEGELVYPFAAPDLASAAAREQASRCAGGRCSWVTSSSVEGPLVRYGVHVRTAPTSGRTVLAIAEPTRPLASVPPEGTPAPGTPASGVYQKFVDIKADSCPTHSAGQRFPNMMTTVMIEHRNGKAFTTLGSAEPRAPGIMTSSPMKNVELTPGAVLKSESKHLCPGYTIARTMTVVSVSGDRIKVRDEVRHIGSTATCVHRNLPSNCATDAVSTWVLARPSCDGRCDGTIVGREDGYVEGEPAPKLDVKCSCP